MATLSTLNPTKTLSEVLVDKINYIIEDRVNVEPYVAWVSKNQLLWGSGFHFKNAPTDYLKSGLFKHAGLNRPTNSERLRWFKRYGFCQDFPPISLIDGIQQTIRDKFVLQSDDRIAKNNRYTHLKFLYGKGYVDEDTGEFVNVHHKYIYGYFIHQKDSIFADDIASYIVGNDKDCNWIRKQWENCSKTHLKMVNDQIKSGEQKALINSILIENDQHLQIDSKLDKKIAIPFENKSGNPFYSSIKQINRKEANG